MKYPSSQLRAFLDISGVRLHARILGIRDQATHFGSVSPSFFYTNEQPKYDRFRTKHCISYLSCRLLRHWFFESNTLIQATS